MNTALCTLLGTLLIVIGVAVVHGWVRLWHRVIEGKWKFDRGDVVAAHACILFFSVMLAMLLTIGHALGCYLWRVL